ncbi:efflux RND transporter periplasmic adaptor subunit [Acidimangrovimonas sediminis]|uniref:efflux RND transporter periplasmic adaptor subunit n=1 Tax=Acidimangrovimonas sediminis TaxID=2056283 RepID=UPI0011AF5F5F|nr:efflux RND transporter periplasmic adaptor subunit [Acidimangrovimonas sediminis]
MRHHLPPAAGQITRRAAATLIVAALAVFCAWAQARAEETVPTVRPVTAPVTRALYETGTVKAVNSVDLVARVSGTLEKIDYQDGQEVKKGDLLFVIEPAPYRAALKQAEASVAQAQASLSDAQRTLDRDMKLVTSSVPQSQVDTARSQRDEAQAQLTSAEAQRDQAQINMGYTEIRAPFDGYVSAHEADVGALVGQGGTTTLATIVQLDPVEVDFAVSDTDVLRLRKQIKARGLTLKDLSTVKVEAATQIDKGYPVTGHLDYIAPQTNSATGTLSARAVFDNPDRSLLPGLFVRLRIPLETVPDALFLPDSAIGADQGGSYVLAVGADGKVTRRDVTLGQRGDTGQKAGLQEVEGDLKASDRVVENVLSGVRPGDTIATSN